MKTTYKIFSLIFVLSVSTLSSQVHGKFADKTLTDTSFSKGDIIKIPELCYNLSHPISDMVMDSLNIVAEFLKKHPSLKVEIGCHTDSRGDSNKNLQLSIFRAEKVREYLITAKGIDASRLTCKGYGETFNIISESEILKAKTKEDIEKLHRINRRTELKVLAIN